MRIYNADNMVQQSERYLHQTICDYKILLRFLILRAVKHKN